MFNFFRKKEFQIKVVPSWFSNDYASFKFVNRKGKWEYIYAIDKPLNWHNEDYSLKRLAYKINFNLNIEEQFKYEFKKWDSLEKIEKYQNDTIEELRKLQQERQKEIKGINNKKNNWWNKQ